MVTHLKALAFLLVGENLLAHKLCGLFTCLLVFAAFWRLLDFHFGRKAARVGALLFLFGPTSLQQMSLLSLGIHFESMALGLFILDEGLRVLGEKSSSRGRLLRLGLASGFGLFFSYQNALVIGWAGLLILLLRPRVVFSKQGAIGIFGLLLGALPLLYMAWHVGGALFDIHGTSLTARGSNWERVQSLAGSVFQRGETWSWFLVRLYSLGGLVGLGAALVLSGRQSDEAWPGKCSGRLATWGLAGFAVLWTTVWYLGPFVSERMDHWFGWLRFAPLTLVVIALCATGIVRALAIGGLLAKGSRALFALVVLAGIVQAGRLVTHGQPATLMANWKFLSTTKGYDYRGYFPSLLKHLRGDAELGPQEVLPSPEQVRPLLGFQEPHPELLLSDLAERWFDDQRIHLDFEAQIDALAALKQDGQDAFLHGMGLSVLVAAKCRQRPELALVKIQGFDEPRRTQLAEAIGYSIGRPATLERLLHEIRSVKTGPLSDAYLFGAGGRAYRSLVVGPYGLEHTLNPAAIAEVIMNELPDRSARLLEGFEAEQRRWTLP